MGVLQVSISKGRPLDLLLYPSICCSYLCPPITEPTLSSLPPAQASVPPPRHLLKSNRIERGGGNRGQAWCYPRAGHGEIGSGSDGEKREIKLALGTVAVWKGYGGGVDTEEGYAQVGNDWTGRHFGGLSQRMGTLISKNDLTWGTPGLLAGARLRAS